jgi:hypothetical protein
LDCGGLSFCKESKKNGQHTKEDKPYQSIKQSINQSINQSTNKSNNQNLYQRNSIICLAQAEKTKAFVELWNLGVVSCWRILDQQT